MPSRIHGSFALLAVKSVCQSSETPSRSYSSTQSSSLTSSMFPTLSASSTQTPSPSSTMGLASAVITVTVDFAGSELVDPELVASDAVVTAFAVAARDGLLAVLAKLQPGESGLIVSISSIATCDGTTVYESVARRRALHRNPPILNPGHYKITDVQRDSPDAIFGAEGLIDPSTRPSSNSRTLQAAGVGACAGGEPRVSATMSFANLPAGISESRFISALTSSDGRATFDNAAKASLAASSLISGVSAAVDVASVLSAVVSVVTPSPSPRPFLLADLAASLSGFQVSSWARVVSSTLLLRSPVAVGVPSNVLKRLVNASLAFGAPPPAAANEPGRAVDPLFNALVSQAESAAQGSQLFAPPCGGDVLSSWRPTDNVSQSHPDLGDALAARISVGEPVILQADTFLYNSNGDVIARPVVVNLTAVWVPYVNVGSAWPLGDARLALYSRLFDLSRVSKAQQSAELAIPTGVLLTVSSARWTLVGCSVPALNSTVRFSPALNPCGGSGAFAVVHNVSLSTTSLAVSVGDLLRAGHLYSVSVSLEFTARAMWAGAPFIGLATQVSNPP